MLFIYVAIIIVVSWTIATYYVEQQGPIVFKKHIAKSNKRSAIVVFDPDPISSNDYDVSEILMQALNAAHWNTTLASVQKAEEMDLVAFDLFVFCPNVYTFGADRAIKNFVKDAPFLQDKYAAVVAIGSLGVEKARIEVETLIEEAGGKTLNTEALQTLFVLNLNNTSSEESGLHVASEWARSLNHIFLKK